MDTYSKFRPTTHDQPGLGCEDQQDWLVAPCGHNRDSECLTESNWASQLAMLQAVDPDGADHEVHRFGHWGSGWFEIVLVRPGSKACVKAESIESALDNYPVLDEDDFSRRKDEAAQEMWAHCFDDAERIAYIRNYRSQFEFRSLSDMMGCVRGKYFCGYASELLG